jgi:hypothetical protein
MKLLRRPCIAVIAAMLHAACANSADCRGLWSADAARLYDAAAVFDTPNESGKAVPSPDKKWNVVGEEESIVLRRGSRTWVLPTLPLTKALMEALWSPDSRYFAINQSDGGAVGTWQVHIYEVTERSGPRLTQVEKTALARANKLPDCFEPESANLGAVAWFNGGSELLLVSQVPPHSSCTNMGDTTTFRVSMRSGHTVMDTSPMKPSWRAHFGCEVPFGPSGQPDRP